MTTYPNREHRSLDMQARQRARRALLAIAEDAEAIRRRLNDPAAYIDSSDTRRMAEEVATLAGQLNTLEVLRQVRQWHAADEQEKAAEGGPAGSWACVQCRQPGEGPMPHDRICYKCRLRGGPPTDLEAAGRTGWTCVGCGSGFFGTTVPSDKLCGMCSPPPER